MTTMQTSFADRLKRIDDYQRFGDACTRSNKQPAKTVVQNARYPFGFMLALTAGVLTVFIAQYANFVLLGVPDAEENLDLALIRDGTTALMLGFMCWIAMFQMSYRYFWWLVAGGFIALCTWHNAVHAFPGLFTMMFAYDWMDAIREMTNPGTIMIPGIRFQVF